MSSSWFYAVTDLLVGRALSPPSQPSIIKRAEDIATNRSNVGNDMNESRRTRTFEWQ